MAFSNTKYVVFLITKLVGLMVTTPAFGARGPGFNTRPVFLFFSKTRSGKLDQIQFFLLAKCTLDIAKHFNVEI